MAQDPQKDAAGSSVERAMDTVMRRAGHPEVVGSAAGGQTGASNAPGEGPHPPLSVLLPVHNGADHIERVLSDLFQEISLPLGAELVVCEDGSTDGTDQVLRGLATKYPFRIISDSHRKGYGPAIRDGFGNIQTPLVFFSDSDGQYDSSDFWRLWPYVQESDMVIGCKVKREESFHRVALSRGFHILTKVLFNVPLEDIDCGFRIIRREVFEEILPKVRSLPYSFWAEFTILASRNGFRILQVPISHRPRLRGTSTIYTYLRLPWIVLRQFWGLLELRRRLRHWNRRGGRQ